MKKLKLETINEIKVKYLNLIISDITVAACSGDSLRRHLDDFAEEITSGPVPIEEGKTVELPKSKFMEDWDDEIEALSERGMLNPSQMIARLVFLIDKHKADK